MQLAAFNGKPLAVAQVVNSFPDVRVQVGKHRFPDMRVQWVSAFRIAAGAGSR